MTKVVNRTEFINDENRGPERTANLLQSLFGDLDFSMPQKVSVGRKEAESLLTLNVKNRKPSSHHKAWIATQMESDMWKYAMQTIPISTEGNILDRQHTLMAIAMTGLSFDFIIETGIDPDAIYVIDTGKKRIPADVLSMEGIKNASLAAAIVVRTIALRIKQFNKVKAKGESGSVTGGQKRMADFLLTNESILMEYLQHEKGYEESVAYGKKLSDFNKSVVPSFWGSMYMWLSEYNYNVAGKFLLKVAKGISNSEDCPSYVLRRKLQMMQDDKDREGVIHHSREYVFHFVNSFNRFLKNEKMHRSLSYSPESLIPELGE